MDTVASIKRPTTRTPTRVFVAAASFVAFFSAVAALTGFGNPAATAAGAAVYVALETRRPSDWAVAALVYGAGAASAVFGLDPYVVAGAAGVAMAAARP